jgi:hypothetical protein
MALVGEMFMNFSNNDVVLHITNACFIHYKYYHLELIHAYVCTGFVCFLCVGLEHFRKKSRRKV